MTAEHIITGLFYAAVTWRLWYFAAHDAITQPIRDRLHWAIVWWLQCIYCAGLIWSFIVVFAAHYANAYLPDYVTTGIAYALGAHIGSIIAVRTIDHIKTESAHRRPQPTYRRGDTWN